MTKEADGAQQIATTLPVYPTQVRVAGWILLVQGGLFLSAALGLLVWSVWLMATKSAMGAVCWDWWLLLIPALPGYLLLRVGLNYVTGAARGTPAFGVLFIVLGVLVGLVAVLLFVTGAWDLYVGFRGANALSPSGRVLVGGVGLLVALGLAGAGVMLFAGRRPYRAWKQAARSEKGAVQKRGYSR